MRCRPLPAGSAEDSVSFLPALTGKPVASTRAGVIHHSISGHFAYRQKNWKLILASGSAGWTAPKTVKDGPKAQLYDLSADPGEKDNRYTSDPERAKALLALLEKDVNSGRSTKGPASANDVPVVLWKDQRTGTQDQRAGKKKNRKKPATK